MKSIFGGSQVSMLQVGGLFLNPVCVLYICDLMYGISRKSLRYRLNRNNPHEVRLFNIVI